MAPIGDALDSQTHPLARFETGTAVLRPPRAPIKASASTLEDRHASIVLPRALAYPEAGVVADKGHDGAVKVAKDVVEALLAGEDVGLWDGAAAAARTCRGQTRMRNTSVQSDRF